MSEKGPVAGQARRWRVAWVVAAAAVLGFVAVLLVVANHHGPDTSAASSARPSTTKVGATNPSTNWTTYHGDTLETGVAATGLEFSHPIEAWRSRTLDGQLYGEPLIEGNLVLAATENDTVYALDTVTGSVVWHSHLGSPVPSTSLPCGNISPTVGITSTPVIDAARSEVFVVADERQGRAITHHLVALVLATGKVVLDQAVDPPRSNHAALLQRAALTLDQGSVVIGFGGNYGDCSTYHGWLVSAPESGGAVRTWEADASSGNDQGAIWMGGAAPVVDASGDIWVATGNGSNTSGTNPDGSDSVIQLNPALNVLQSFTASTWRTDNAKDFDLGSQVPTVLGNGLVFQAGKSQTAYLLDAASLGGIGGQLSQLRSFCGNDVDGGTAFTSSVVYVPCQNGIMAVAIDSSAKTMRVEWRTPTSSSGPPIVAGGLVWTLSQSGTLYGLRRADGSSAVALSVGAPANHFPTPAVGAGLLVAANVNQLVAFR